jgi:hypothetical protein
MDDVAVVLGGAAPEEVAAVMAVLSALAERGRGAGPAGRDEEPPSGYGAWRVARLAALRRYPCTTWNSLQ